MIIYGTSYSKVTGDDIGGYVCPHCEAEHWHTFGFVNYFHIWYIPFVMLGRNTGIQCAYCKAVYENDEIPHELAESLRAELFSKLRLLFSNMGLIALFSFIGYLSIIESIATGL